jgi:formylglycine-generating enzyme required for sulfatase activity
VGTKQANQFGLHDMHGNVFEWCEDWHQADFYQELVDGCQPVIDPVCENAGSGIRVARSDGFGFNALLARSAFRSGADPSYRDVTLGFRPVRPLP